MIRTFSDPGTDDIFNGRDTPAARRTLPTGLWNVAHRKLSRIDDVRRLSDLRVPPSNRLEALRGDRGGQHSIRINRRFRVCFRWTGTDAHDVEIVDYH